jgi:hypothetical protein
MYRYMQYPLSFEENSGYDNLSFTQLLTNHIFASGQSFEKSPDAIPEQVTRS